MINPFKSKKGLGRGLSSLIGDIDSKPKKNKILISSLVRNKFQPRKNFDKEKMEELANSIRERGILQPIIVRKSSDQSDKFEIIAGERRWQAAQSAGLHEVPVVEIAADDLQSLEFAIVENVQRSDLNPIEEAKGYKKLIDEFDYDQEKVSKFIAKSRAHVANALRLLSLPSEVILLIEDNKISAGHAKVLVGLDNAYFLAKKIIDKKLSVRQAENLIRILKSNKGKNKISKNPNLISLESSIQEKIGIKVFIRNKKNNTGQITFEYKDLDQLNRLLSVIKSNY
jgi:ParB family chromosome partitioning protein|tara:strand:+ start:1452 stop:2303 length:852 start_codon:yes stop_codon:yes gene_type:complete